MCSILLGLDSPVHSPKKNPPPAAQTLGSEGRGFDSAVARLPSTLPEKNPPLAAQTLGSEGHGFDFGVVVPGGQCCRRSRPQRVRGA